MSISRSALMHVLLSTLFSTLLAASAAQAGVIITRLDPDAGGIVPVIKTGALDLFPTLPSSGWGVASAARYFQSRTSQEIVPATGALQYQHLQADSGWNVSAQSGDAVGAYASIEVSPLPPQPPAQARSAPFENHARATSGDRFEMINDTPVTVSGVDYPALSIYRTSANEAAARSAWFDTWQANLNGPTQLTVNLNGSFALDNLCSRITCLHTPPTGANRITRRGFDLDFEANFLVLDLDTLVTCDDPDECSSPAERPMAVAQLNARFVRDIADTFPSALNLQEVLSFESQAGHRYLVVGIIDATGNNGAIVDFYNSMHLSGVDAPIGAFTSAALGGDLASHFLTPVPEPGSVALWVTGLAALVALAGRRRGRQARA